MINRNNIVKPMQYFTSFSYDVRITVSRCSARAVETGGTAGVLDRGMREAGGQHAALTGEDGR
jgi:hypothetical protein